VVQTCIVHLIRHSLKYVPRREREQVARDLKPIYTAVDADAAQQALERFDEKWAPASRSSPKRGLTPGSA
jgi:transposase-like protein